MSSYSKFFKQFNRQDRLNPPSSDINLFVGSSSFRHWTSLQKDMFPKPVLNRGFGGSTMKQLLEFHERLILRYQFKKLFIYEGDNDMGGTPDKLKALLYQLKKIIEIAHEHQAHAQIYVLSPKCSPTKQGVCQKMIERNKQLKAVCDNYSYVYYVDIASGFMNDNYEVKTDFFKDGIHPSQLGYAYMTKILKPLLYPED